MNPKPIYLTKPIDPQPQILYNQALTFCKQKNYLDALAIFLKVYEMVPNFPYIVSNINQCALFCRIHKIYSDGQILFTEGHFLEAWKHFVYIEQSLKQNYCDCLQMIELCKVEFIKQKINEQLQQFLLQELLDEEIRQKTEQLQEIYEKIMVFQIRQQQQQQQQAQINYEEPLQPQVIILSVEPGPSQDQIMIEQVKKVRQKIEKIKIFYTCVNKEKCLNPCENQIMKHFPCNTDAYVCADGYICCEQSSCERYFITDAIFNCQQHTVQVTNDTLDQSNYEKIDQFYLLYYFNDDSMKGNPQYHDADKDEFLLNFPNEEIMRRGVRC